MSCTVCDVDFLYGRRRRYPIQSETEISYTVGDGDVLYGQRRRCHVWPEMTVESGTS